MCPVWLGIREGHPMRAGGTSHVSRMDIPREQIFWQLPKVQ